MLGDIEAVVATEETVRGTDFVWLDAVLLMNVPCSALEYLHICGRVGRLGKKGEALVVVDSTREIKRMERMYKKLKINGKGIGINL